MSTLEKLQQKRGQLAEQLRDLDAKLTDTAPGTRLSQLERDVDEAVKDGNTESIDAAVEALQAARSGTDAATTDRVRIEAQRRVVQKEIESTDQAIEAEQKNRMEQRYVIAKELLAELRDEYEVHARAILDLYPRLYARAQLTADTGFPLGLHRTIGGSPIFQGGFGLSLPVAGGVGLPPDLAGNLTYHREEFEKEKEAAKAELEARFESQS